MIIAVPCGKFESADEHRETLTPPAALRLRWVYEVKIVIVRRRRAARFNDVRTEDWRRRVDEAGGRMLRQ